MVALWQAQVVKRDLQDSQTRREDPSQAVTQKREQRGVVHRNDLLEINNVAKKSRKESEDRKMVIL